MKQKMNIYKTGFKILQEGFEMYEKHNKSNHIACDHISDEKIDEEYVIKLLDTIISKCEKHVLDTVDLRLSILTSCKSLKAQIIGKNLKGHQSGIKAFRCENCNEIYFSLPNQRNALCPRCYENIKVVE